MRTISPFIRVTITYSLCLAVALQPIVLSAEEFSRKEYRQQFLSENLQKNYYKIQVQTIKFFNRQQSDVNGLVESFRGTSVYAYDIFTRAFCYGKRGALDCQSFTYDGSVAALAFLFAGQTRKAADILKVYRKEFYCVKNGVIGLYNSYRTDVGAGGNNGLMLGVDGDRIHLGPTMWVSIAALQYTALTGDLQFLSFIIDTVRWAERLEHFQFSDGARGGVCMGSGWGVDWSKVYSTENNVDYYAVLSMLQDLYDNGGGRVRNIFDRKHYRPEDIGRSRSSLLRWFREIAYDPERKSFNCGYNEKGPDRTAALDTISWTIAALGPETLDEMGINPFFLMNYAEKNFRVASRIKEIKVEGYDFTSAEGRQSPVRVIWLEGTGFHTVTYQLMARYAKKLGLDQTAGEYREKVIKYADEMEKVSQLVKLQDSALPYTTRKLGEKEIIMTFIYEWEIPRGHKGQWVASASSTAWRYFALAGFNPMAFDREAVFYPLFERPGVKHASAR